MPPEPPVAGSLPSGPTDAIVSPHPGPLRRGCGMSGAAALTCALRAAGAGATRRGEKPTDPGTRWPVLASAISATLAVTCHLPSLLFLLLFRSQDVEAFMRILMQAPWRKRG